MSIEPFNRLVKLVARAFYDDVTPKGDNPPKPSRGDTRGIGVVLLDTLTRKQWVREEDLAKELNLHPKQLRRTLRLFEEEKFVTRDHRRETAKGAKMHNAALAATVDGQPSAKVGEEKVKMHMHSYCCLDYAQIFDVVRYRMHRMKKRIKDELEDKNTIQEYVCPGCGKRYNALDALQLVSMEDEYFQCEKCNGELVAESDSLAVQDVGDGDGDDNARRRRRENLKGMLQKMEVQFKPLMEQLTRVKDLPVPEFGSLQAWEARARASVLGLNGDSGSNDPSKFSQGYSATPMPFLGDTTVEVAFSGIDGKEDVKSESASTSLKVLPPWMIKQGMNLKKEQLGDVKQQLETDGSSAQPDFSDDKKSTVENDGKKNLQDEYLKAYYEALFNRQQEFFEDPSSDLGDSSKRQVGMKSERDENEGEDDIDWEEAPSRGNTTESYNLNFKAEASGDDEDDIDWEED